MENLEIHGRSELGTTLEREKPSSKNVYRIIFIAAGIIYDTQSVKIFRMASKQNV